jgi:hypothetical protein
MLKAARNMPNILKIGFYLDFFDWLKNNLMITNCYAFVEGKGGWA